MKYELDKLEEDVQYKLKINKLPFSFFLSIVISLVFLVLAIIYHTNNKFELNISYIDQYITLFGIFVLFGFFLGLSQLNIKYFEDWGKAYSLFSPLHIILPTFIYLFSYKISQNNPISLLLSLGLSNTWELLEIALKRYGEKHNKRFLKRFAQESTYNTIVDIYLHIIGVIIGFFLLGF
jgi:hypothetical protein